MTWQQYFRDWILNLDYIDPKTRGEIVAAADSDLIHQLTVRLGESSLAGFTLDICDAYRRGRITN